MSQDPVYAKKKIQIYTSDRKLYLLAGQRDARIYPIAVGKPATPTPAGIYHVINKIVHPGGILGTRWMGLDIPNGPYGIHGTFQADSIGRAVSNGCIRMYNQDVEELFSQIKIGTTVAIDKIPQDGGGDFTLYVTKPGDTLWDISRRFGVSVSELAAFNNIDNPDNLPVGMELKIPKR